jgi:2-C-methyl-D-erythritol 4-phosphate cytidylyltransferase/2-C-methyl-D-erythritol 2,4-cyclodiphosphate synthase
MHETLAILVGAGRGERMAAGRPKAFLDLAGDTLLTRSARAFDRSPSVQGVVAVVPAELVEEARGQLQGCAKLRAVVPGGARRQDSVWLGLQACTPEFDGVVLVHDAARPFVDAATIAAVAAKAAEDGAAIPVVPVADTVKRAEGTVITGTVDRSVLRAAQTPQGFRAGVLRQAYEAAIRDGAELTDEAMAVERLGGRVTAVDGSPENRKLTTPEDLAWARERVAGAAPWRVGSGFDVHRLVPGRPLRLGGVSVAYDRGLEGHSDGDCVLHAVCDALLGAAALGDMGTHFPSTDERWRGADSVTFLSAVAGLLRARGIEIGNVDVTVIAEAPRLGPHVEAMRNAIVSAAAVALDAVSVKVKSCDGLGAVGRGEGIAAEAVALVRRPRGGSGSE